MVYPNLNTNTDFIFQTLLKREDGSVDFNRTWAYYKYGFGNVFGEYWFGEIYNSVFYIHVDVRQ